MRARSLLLFGSPPHWARIRDAPCAPSRPTPPPRGARARRLLRADALRCSSACSARARGVRAKLRPFHDRVASPRRLSPPSERTVRPSLYCPTGDRRRGHTCRPTRLRAEARSRAKRSNAAARMWPCVVRGKRSSASPGGRGSVCFTAFAARGTGRSRPSTESESVAGARWSRARRARAQQQTRRRRRRPSRRRVSGSAVRGGGAAVASCTSTSAARRRRKHARARLDGVAVGKRLARQARDEQRRRAVRAAAVGGRPPPRPFFARPAAAGGGAPRSPSAPPAAAAAARGARSRRPPQRRQRRAACRFGLDVSGRRARRSARSLSFFLFVNVNHRRPSPYTSLTCRRSTAASWHTAANRSAVRALDGAVPADGAPADGAPAAAADGAAARPATAIAPWQRAPPRRCAPRPPAARRRAPPRRKRRAAARRPPPRRRRRSSHRRRRAAGGGGRTRIDHHPQIVMFADVQP